MRKSLARRCSGALAFSMLCVLAQSATAGITANFKVNGTAVNAYDTVEVVSEVENNFRYTGGEPFWCYDISWKYRAEGHGNWQEFDNDGNAKRTINQFGTHELKMKVNGKSGLFCSSSKVGTSDERVINLVNNQAGKAQTKYPIMIVPGVFAWDSMLGIEYFYRIADTIEESSDQPVIDVSLHPWQETEARGEDLADKIKAFIEAYNETYGVSNTKVNLLAHSHGSTTSRVAIKKLKDQGLDYVASLTTVAGPHYGTPTADGSTEIMNDWGVVGESLEATLVPLIDFLSEVVVLLSGESDQYCSEEDKMKFGENLCKMEVLQVVEDFTQPKMKAFNTNFPSYGVPTGGKYYQKGYSGNSADYTGSPLEAFGATATPRNCVNYSITVGNESSTQCLVVGNGLGGQASPFASNAVQYYSFTGDGPAFTNFDPVDVALALFHWFGNPLYMEEQGLDYPVLYPPTDFIPSDSFIPVSSGYFGKHIGTYYWNHVDEQNATLELISGSAADPKEVYKSHAERLKKSGL